MSAYKNSQRQVLAGCCLIILDIYLIIRNRTGIAQDKLGVMIGMDESCSSARMSRYETGIHEPPIAIAGKIAHALNLPLLYFYCDGEQLAEILLYYATFNARKKAELLDFAKKSSQSD